MCKVKAPTPQVIKEAKPTFVRNPFLDDLDGDVATVDALRRGRSSLVIPTAGDASIGFAGRGSAGSRSGTGGGSAYAPPGSNATGGGTSPYGTTGAGGSTGAKRAPFVKRYGRPPPGIE